MSTAAQLNISISPRPFAFFPHSYMRRDIQGLRGWAILLVLLFHFFPKRFPNGYIGVDIFFVISGFLISMILDRYERMDLATLRTFYYRRAKRILPLYLVFVWLTLLSLLFLFPSRFVDINATSGWRAVLFMSNIKDAASENYEQQLSNALDLFTHSWSLAVEIQFYVIVPVLFFAQTRLHFPSTLFFSAISTLSFVLSLYVDNETAFNSVFCRVWQFATGIIAYKCSERKDITIVPTTTASDNIPVKYIMYTIFVWQTVSLTDWELDERYHRITITLSIAILLILGKVDGSWLLSNRIIVYIGNISYSLYLFHWPIYVYVNSQNSNESLVAGISVVFCASAIVYHLFETQYLKFDRTKITKLIGSLYTLCILSLLILKYDDSLISSIYNTEISMNTNENSTENGKQTIEFVTSIPLDEALSINVKIENDKNSIFTSKICEHKKTELLSKTYPENKIKPFGLCEYPTQTGNLSMLIIGNSYAGNQADTIFKAFRNQASEFRLFYMSWFESLAKSSEIQNFKDAVAYYKPDVLFIVDRCFLSKYVYNTTLEEDNMYKDMLDSLRFYEEHTSERVFILQALPSLIERPMVAAQKWLKKGLALERLGDALTVFDEKPARQRLAKLASVCEKCELVDVLPALSSPPSGHFRPFDVASSVMLFDGATHLSRQGLDRVHSVWTKAAEQFDTTAMRWLAVLLLALPAASAIKCYVGVTIPSANFTSGAEMACDGECASVQTSVATMTVNAYFCSPSALCTGFSLMNNCTHLPTDNKIDYCCCNSGDNCASASDPLVKPAPIKPFKGNPIICHEGIYINNVSVNGAIHNDYKICYGECATLNFHTSIAGQNLTATLFTCDPVSMCKGFGLDNSCQAIDGVIEGCCCNHNGCLDPSKPVPVQPDDSELKCFVGVKAGDYVRGGEMVCGGHCGSIDTNIGGMNVTAMFCAPAAICKGFGIHNGCLHLKLDRDIDACCCNHRDNCNVHDPIPIPTVAPYAGDPISCYEGVTLNGQPIGDPKYVACSGDCGSVTFNTKVANTSYAATVYSCDPVSLCKDFSLSNSCGSLDNGVLSGCCCNSHDACLDPTKNRPTPEPVAKPNLKCFVGLEIGKNFTQGAEMACDGECGWAYSQVNGVDVSAYFCAPYSICKGLGIRNSCMKLPLDQKVFACCCDDKDNCHATDINPMPTLPPTTPKPITCNEGISVGGVALTSRVVACAGECASVTINTSINGTKVAGTIFSCDPASLCKSLGVQNKCAAIDGGMVSGCCCDSDMCLGSNNQIITTTTLAPVTTTSAAGLSLLALCAAQLARLF